MSEKIILQLGLQHIIMEIAIAEQVTDLESLPIPTPEVFPFVVKVIELFCYCWAEDPEVFAELAAGTRFSLHFYHLGTKTGSRSPCEMASTGLAMQNLGPEQVT